MSRIFDVGPLPQMTLPPAIDTQTVAPIDLKFLGQMLNDKSRTDIMAKNADRQMRMSEMTSLHKLVDDMTGILKNPDGSEMTPYSKYQEEVFSRTKQKMNTAASNVFDLYDRGDYSTAYKSMFDAQNQILQDKDFLKAYNENKSISKILQTQNLDEWSVGSLVKEAADYTTPIENEKLALSNFAKFDADKAIESFITSMKPVETSDYQMFDIDPTAVTRMREGQVKIEHQQPSWVLEQQLKSMIDNSPRFQKYLDDRGISQEDYIKSTIAPHLIQGIGASYIYEEDDQGNYVLDEEGNKKVIGVYRIKDKEGKEVVENKESKDSSSGGAGGHSWDFMMNNATGATDPTLFNMEGIETFDAFRNTYYAAESQYQMVKQAFDVQTKGLNITGTENTGDRIQDIMNTVTKLGDLDLAKKQIKFLRKDGTEDVAAENNFFNTLYPQTVKAYTERQILAKGEEKLMENTYDYVAKNFSGGEEGLAKLGITKGAKGEVVFPPSYGNVYQNRQTQPTQMIGGLDPGPQTPGKNPQQEIADLMSTKMDKNLESRYDKYFKEEADVLKYWVIPDEATGEKYEQARQISNQITQQVLGNKIDFYASDATINNGLPMYMKKLNENGEKPQSDKYAEWKDLDVVGIGIDAERGNFFVTAYPRVQVLDSDFFELGNEKLENQHIEDVNGKKFLVSDTPIIIPWNKFGDSFYETFYSKFKSYAGLYDALAAQMNEELPEGTPIRVDMGGRDVYITPNGPVGTDRSYNLYAPKEIVPSIETNGPDDLPGTTTSNVSTPKSTGYIEPAPKPAVDPTGVSLGVTQDAAKASEGAAEMQELFDENPYLKAVVGAVPQNVTKSETGQVSTTPANTGTIVADNANTKPAIGRVYNGSLQDITALLEKATTGQYVKTNEQREADKQALANEMLPHLDFQASGKGENTNHLKNLTAEAINGLKTFDKFIERNFARAQPQAAKPVITSTYRTEERNNAPDVRGAKNSHHLTGNAIDIDYYGAYGRQLAVALNKARKQGTETYNNLLTELFGTKDVYVLDPYNDPKGHNDHIHVQFN
jgi:uncharacterized protein YcbK (DUF882 family)